MLLGSRKAIKLCCYAVRLEESDQTVLLCCKAREKQSNCVAMLLGSRKAISFFATLLGSRKAIKLFCYAVRLEKSNQTVLLCF